MHLLDVLAGQQFLKSISEVLADRQLFCLDPFVVISLCIFLESEQALKVFDVTVFDFDILFERVDVSCILLYQCL